MFIIESNMWKYTRAGYIAPDGELIEGSHGGILAQLIGKAERGRPVEEQGFVRYLLTYGGDLSISCVGRVGHISDIGPKQLENILRLLDDLKYQEVSRAHVDLGELFQADISGSPNVVSELKKKINQELNK